jgi:hypothetical protein
MSRRNCSPSSAATRSPESAVGEPTAAELQRRAERYQQLLEARIAAQEG